jgi:hypothetical protein
MRGKPGEIDKAKVAFNARSASSVEVKQRRIPRSARPLQNNKHAVKAKDD